YISVPFKISKAHAKTVHGPSLSFTWLMEDDVSNPFRRMLMRTRKIAPKMVVALASNDNKTQ
ncbi:hypothetical protein OIU85_019869, partial [Salix viminalis]